MAIESDWHDHPLTDVLQSAVEGRFPDVDGVIEIVPPDAAGTTAIAEFTGHALILTARTADDPLFDGRDAFGGAQHPEVQLGLAGSAGTNACLDVVMVRHGVSKASIALAPTDKYDAHGRVMRARHHRRNVTVLGDDRGLVCLGHGLVGRLELSIETVIPGTGASLLEAGLAAIDDDVPVFAQVSPGNARSLRLFLAAGFTPIGSETIIGPVR